MQHIIIMAVTGLLLGFATGFGIRAIANKCSNTLHSAIYGCLLGIAVIVCALIVGYFVYYGGAPNEKQYKNHANQIAFFKYSL